MSDSELLQLALSAEHGASRTRCDLGEVAAARHAFNDNFSQSKMLEGTPSRPRGDTSMQRLESPHVPCQTQPMGRRLLALMALCVLALNVESCTRACTEKACWNNLELRFAEPIATSGELLITIDAEGQSYSCLLTDGDTTDCVGLHVTVDDGLREIHFFAQTPKSLHLKIESNGSVVLEQDVNNIRYSKYYANGEDCDDEACHSASVALK
ncbi:MAG: hypothetical protein R3B07_07020 [Polyangiaceae bacterium]